MRNSHLRCIYCNDPAECMDHTISFSSVSSRLRNLRRWQNRDFQVPACNSCNSILGAGIFGSMLSRMTFLLGRLYDKRAEPQRIKFLLHVIDLHVRGDFPWLPYLIVDPVLRNNCADVLTVDRSSDQSVLGNDFVPDDMPLSGTSTKVEPPENFIAVPQLRSKSRKQLVYERYQLEGTLSARKYAVTLGLKQSTFSSWLHFWKQGYYTRSHNGKFSRLESNPP